MTDVATRLGCFGYYGFGGGYEQVKRPAPDGAQYCSRCPKANACWAANRSRAGMLLPAATDAFEQLVAKGLTGGPLLEAWNDLVQAQSPGPRVLDPYMHLMVNNMRAGIELATTGKVGPAKLFPSWPLTPISEVQS